MNFMKKQGVGFYLTALTILASVVGLAFCMVNGGTNSFHSIGTGPAVIGCAAAAIVALLLYLILGQKPSIAADIMPVVAGVALVIATISFIAPRVNTIASIMTFTNNAQTMADLNSAIFGTACLLAAVVLNIVASFTKVTREG